MNFSNKIIKNEKSFAKVVFPNSQPLKSTYLGKHNIPKLSSKIKQLNLAKKNISREKKNMYKNIYGVA